MVRWALAIVSVVGCGKSDGSSGKVPAASIDKGEKAAGTGGERVAPKPRARYVVDAETIADSTSHLTWALRLPEEGTPPVGQKAVLWETANKFCEQLNTAGKDDWRVPSLADLDTVTRQGGGGNWSTVMSSETWHCEANGVVDSGVPLAFLTGLVSRYLMEPSSPESLRASSRAFLHPCSELLTFWSADTCSVENTIGHRFLYPNAGLASTLGSECGFDVEMMGRFPPTRAAIRCVRGP